MQLLKKTLFIAGLFFSFLGLNAQNQAPFIEEFYATDYLGFDPSLPEIVLKINDPDNEFVSIRLYRILPNETEWTLFFEDTNVLVGQLYSPYYFESVNEIFISGPFKLEVSDNEPGDIQALVNEVNTDSLYYFMENIVGTRHRTEAPEHLESVKDFIDNTFQEYDFETSRQDFPFGNYTGENIIGKKTGETQNVYIIDGHFDTVFDSPGADDNGSAVAGMLEAARVLKNAKLTDNVHFIGFDLEETGLDGSIEYVTNGIAEEDTIKGVLNLEMIAYYDENPNTNSLPVGFDILFPEAAAQVADNEFKGDFINNIANENSAELMASYQENAEIYVPELKVLSFAAPGNAEIAPDLRRSDHAPFWDAGIPALMLTDGANFRNPYYHTPNDTLGTLNFDFMSNVVKASIATIANLAGYKNSATAYTDIEVISNNTEIELPVVTLFYAKNSISVELEKPNFTWQIADINGRLISQGMETNNNSEIIVPETLSSGVYFFTALQDGKKKCLRFLVE